MKALFNTTFVLVLMVCLTGCPSNKKKGARFQDRQARAMQVTQRQANVGVSTVVYGVDQYGQYRSHASWMSSVTRLVSPSVSREYLTDVSQDGSDNTGVFFGARLCLNRYASSSIPTQALVVVQVYDTSGLPIPIYLNAVQSGGYNASTGQVDALFKDEYGSIRIYGQASGSTFQGWVQFDTFSDNYGLENLGTVYMDANQLFSCY